MAAKPERAAGLDDVLSQLREDARVVAEVEARESDLVSRARTFGATWEDLARAMGLGQTTVYLRYSEGGSQRRRRYRAARRGVAVVA